MEFKFSINKCAMIEMINGVIEMEKGLERLNQESIRTLRKKNYK